MAPVDLTAFVFPNIFPIFAPYLKELIMTPIKALYEAPVVETYPVEPKRPLLDGSPTTTTLGGEDAGDEPVPGFI